MVDLKKLSRSLGAISKKLQISGSLVQTAVHKNKLFGCVSTLQRSGISGVSGSYSPASGTIAKWME